MSTEVATSKEPENAETETKTESTGDAETSSATPKETTASSSPSTPVAAAQEASTTAPAVAVATTAVVAVAAAKKGPPPSAVEFEPPVACVRRILKKTLPSSSNVGKDAVAAFARASGIFIIYLTACANDFARENRRQTITANDVLAAIKVCTVL